MGGRDQTWQERALLVMGAVKGVPPRGAIPKLARRLGEDVRKVRFYFDGTVKNPRNAVGFVTKVAAALNVDRDWMLHGGSETPVPASRGDVIPPEMIARVPARFRRLVYAVTVPETAEWLLAQLDLYERARASKAPAR